MAVGVEGGVIFPFSAKPQAICEGRLQTGQYYRPGRRRPLQIPCVFGVHVSFPECNVAGASDSALGFGGKNSSTFFHSRMVSSTKPPIRYLVIGRVLVLEAPRVPICRQTMWLGFPARKDCRTRPFFQVYFGGPGTLEHSVAVV